MGNIEDVRASIFRSSKFPNLANANSKAASGASDFNSLSYKKKKKKKKKIKEEEEEEEEENLIELHLFLMPKLIFDLVMFGNFGLCLLPFFLQILTKLQEEQEEEEEEDNSIELYLFLMQKLMFDLMMSDEKIVLLGFDEHSLMLGFEKEVRGGKLRTLSYMIYIGEVWERASEIIGGSGFL